MSSTDNRIHTNIHHTTIIKYIQTYHIHTCTVYMYTNCLYIHACTYTYIMFIDTRGLARRDHSVWLSLDSHDMFMYIFTVYVYIYKDDSYLEFIPFPISGTANSYASCLPPLAYHALMPERAYRRSSSSLWLGRSILQIGDYLHVYVVYFIWSIYFFEWTIINVCISECMVCKHAVLLLYW